MKYVIVASILFASLALPAFAQTDFEKKAKELKQNLATPIVQWDDAFVISTFQRYLNLYLGLLWDPGFHSKARAYLPRDLPVVRVEVAGELRTPYMRSEEMVVPVEYIRYLMAIGSVVGHDVYVQDHSIDIHYPLLSGPFRTSAIIPLLNPLYSYLDVDGFPALQPYLTCPESDVDCVVIQTQAESSMLLFAMLHELSHEVLHHSVNEEGVNLNHEIAADKNASAVLSLLADEFQDVPTAVKSEIRFAMQICPVMFLQAECDRIRSVDTMPKARKEALLNAFSEKTRSDMESFIDPEHSSMNVIHVTVDWSDVPDLLLIDGISIPIKEIEGKEWTVTGVHHTVIALRSGSIAWAISSVPNEVSTIHLHLLFNPFLPADVVAIEKARKERRWLELLSRTTNVNLQPRDPALTVDHLEALHRLGLNRFIVVQDWNLIPKAAWPKVQNWSRNSGPLSSW